MLCSDEKTHAGFKTALDEVCQVVRPFPELSAVKDAMDVYKKRHGKEDQRKQQAGSRSVSLLVKTRQGGLYLESYTSCSLRSKRFRAVSGQSGRAKNGFSVLTVRKMQREPTNEKGRGRGKKETILSFHSPPHPLFYSTHFLRRLSLLRKHTETLVAQAIPAVTSTFSK